VKPVAAVVAITLLTLAGLLGAGPVTAASAAAPAPAQGQVADGPLRLELADMSPRVVTAGGPRAPGPATLSHRSSHPCPASSSPGHSCRSA
jgi:hypothetical protein